MKHNTCASNCTKIIRTENQSNLIPILWVKTRVALRTLRGVIKREREYFAERESTAQRFMILFIHIHLKVKSCKSPIHSYRAHHCIIMTENIIIMHWNSWAECLIWTSPIVSRRMANVQLPTFMIRFIFLLLTHLMAGILKMDREIFNNMLCCYRIVGLWLVASQLKINMLYDTRTL